MKAVSLFAVCATIIVYLPAGIAMAQSTPDAGAPPSSATSDTDKAAKDTDAPKRNADAPKKKKAAKMTRQQEIDKSVDSGTVPARYRNCPSSTSNTFRSINGNVTAGMLRSDLGTVLAR